MNLLLSNAPGDSEARDRSRAIAEDYALRFPLDSLVAFSTNLE